MHNIQHKCYILCDYCGMNYLWKFIRDDAARRADDAFRVSDERRLLACRSGSNSAKRNAELLMSFQTWAARFLQQVRGVNPFDGDCLPTRVSLFGFGRPALPFPHLWNYKNPIKIFETFYWYAEKETGSGKHNRYLYLAGLPPVLLTREPAVIKAVLAATGDKP